MTVKELRLLEYAEGTFFLIENVLWCEHRGKTIKIYLKSTEINNVWQLHTAENCLLNKIKCFKLKFEYYWDNGDRIEDL